MRRGLLLAAAWALDGRASADTYVGPAGLDVDGCGSKAAPCRTIGRGIEQADAGSVVHVAPGEYTPVEGQDPYFTVNKSLTVVAPEGATIDCQGRSSGADILVSSFSSIALDGLHFKNCTGTVMGGPRHGKPLRPWSIGESRRDKNCRKDWNMGCNCAIGDCSHAGGVSIIHLGYESFDDWLEDPTSAATFTAVEVLLRGCSFTECTAHMGGAVQLMLGTRYAKSSFTFEDCSFTENYISRSHLGILSSGSSFYQTLGFEESGRLDYTLADSNLTFRGCSFSHNSNGWGDGTVSLANNHKGHWANVSIEFDNLTMEDNVVSGNGGGISVQGATPSPTDDSKSYIRISRAAFLRNSGSGSGVGGAFLGTFAYSDLEIDQTELPSNAMETFAYRTFIEVSETKFENNLNFRGGAVAVGNGMITFERVAFWNNTAKQQGGALVLSLGGGDGGVRFHECIFRGNQAEESHCMASHGSGPVTFSKTRVYMLGTLNSKNDIDIFRAGEAWSTNHSEFICPPGSTLSVPNSADFRNVGFSFQTTGPLCSAWNGQLRGIGYTAFTAQCILCPPGRYKIMAPRIQGEFWTRVCNRKNSHERIGNCHMQVYWQTDVVDTYVSEQLSNSSLGDCYECPSGASCTGGNSVELSGRNMYGYLLNRDTGRPVYDGSEPPSESGADWVVNLQHCPRGYCLTKAKDWSRTCLAHRNGFLCGRCDDGYSESWFGAGPCIKNEDCRSWWWMGPLLALCMFAYAMYNYRSAQKGLYTVVDVALFFFQLYPYAVSSSDPGREQMSVGSALLNFAALNVEEAASRAMSVETGEATLKAKLLCLAPGMTAYNRMLFLGTFKLCVPFFVVLGHILAYGCGVKFLRPPGKQLPAAAPPAAPAGRGEAPGAIGQAEAGGGGGQSGTGDGRQASLLESCATAGVPEEGGVPVSQPEAEAGEGAAGAEPQPITPLLAGLYKAFFFCFSGFVQQVFKLSDCVQGHHRYAGMDRCSMNEELVLWCLSLTVVSAPAALAVLSAVVRRGVFMRTSGLVRSVREIQPLHESGMRPGLWWWPFAFACVRGALVLAPIVVDDLAMGAALRAGIVGFLVVLSKLVAPFQHEAANNFQTLLFLLMFFASAFSVVFAVLDVKAVDPYKGGELHHFVGFVISVNFFTIMGAALLTGQILWHMFMSPLCGGEGADAGDGGGNDLGQGILNLVGSHRPGMEMCSFGEGFRLPTS